MNISNIMSIMTIMTIMTIMNIMHIMIIMNSINIMNIMNIINNMNRAALMAIAGAASALIMYHLPPSTIFLWVECVGVAFSSTDYYSVTTSHWLVPLSKVQCSAVKDKTMHSQMQRSWVQFS